MTGASIVSVLVFLAIGGLLLVLARLLLETIGRRAFRCELDEALFEDDNSAIGLVCGGYFVGVALVLWAAFRGGQGELLVDALTTVIYGVWGVALLGATLAFTSRLLVPKLDVAHALSEDRNVGCALVVAAAMVATGANVAASMQGTAPGGILGGLVSMTAAFAIGQASLAVLARLHRLVAHFDIHDEIRKRNAAAACTLAGAFLGNGILLYWGLRGDVNLDAPLDTLAPLGIALAAGVVLLPIVRLVAVRLFFAGIPFDKELSTDRNLAAGTLELVAHGLLALLIASALS